MFETFFTSRSLSRPVYLYDITFAEGDAGRLRLTSAGTPIFTNGGRYDPAQIKHGEIESSGTLDNATLEVKTPRFNPLVEVFRVYPPEQVVNLVIYRGELDDPEAEFTAVWSGRILNFGMELLEATFSCEPIATAVRRPGLRRNYQYGCPHVLYGPQCRADKAAASVAASVAATDGSVVTLNAGWNAHPTAKYLRGMLEWQTEAGTTRRTILQVISPTELLLAGVVRDLAPGTEVTAVLGCGRMGDDCLNLHGNMLNYGGCPWISEINPLGQRSPFY
ncbi:phage BR0599 family protein [Halomonas sp. JS92-SW72]|uniref:phage BR0599 family protein n=1 Tax=Halomonas sp. JS92-SW72 TaxID=2306583 RepID=UPI0013C2ED0E|nr:phage BR0599 family protein [Halomonas sp. JS92-SW72]